MVPLRLVLALRSSPSQGSEASVAGKGPSKASVPVDPRAWGGCTA